MSTTKIKGPVSLGFAGLYATAGDHLAHFYETPAEELDVLVSFLRAGLEAGDKCICLVSSGPILWWNGTGPQGPGRRVAVEVVRVKQESSLASVRGVFLRMLLGEETPIEKWSTTYRAIVRSWRDESLYGITLTGEQFAALPPENGRLSLSVFPGALGLEWYSEVAVVEGPELPDRNRAERPQD